MATVAEFSVPAEEFPLGRIFEDLPDATIELERIVPTTDATFPYFRVWKADADRIVEALANHPALESVTLVDEVGGSGLFRTTWNEDVEGLIPAILRTEITLLSASATRENWRFQFRAEGIDPISEFRRRCREGGIDATLTRLHTLSEMRSGGEYDLTPRQHEALVLAFDRGYYDDERGVSLADLGEELGISRPAVSARLRRGYRNLIGTTISRHDRSE